MRLLIKLSGEALARDIDKNASQRLFNEDTVFDISSQIKTLIEAGHQVGIVIGGGNVWRGRNDLRLDIDRSRSDQIGMLATVMNAIFISEAVRSLGLKTAILTPFYCSTFTKVFSKDRAEKYFEKGMVVFFAGGTGHPYFSTDTGVVLRAIEVGANYLLLAKDIDGVYDKDPKKYSDAKRFDTISLEEVANRNLQVIDMTATILAKENALPFKVFNLHEKNGIVKAVGDSFNGTTVTV